MSTVNSYMHAWVEKHQSMDPWDDKMAEGLQMRKSAGNSDEYRADTQNDTTLQHGGTTEKLMKGKRYLHHPKEPRNTTSLVHGFKAYHNPQKHDLLGGINASWAEKVLSIQSS
ncbi:hypothetical protein VM1G_11946 [Cytospora mali]|uniref:Uncharacterized protein n=1 Tax=Cytospora mali TaxID=578113 RepID=A0A194WCE8_CYTMA|nr:hypothetical protein VM1G_11946 [Valsa mali]